MALMKITTAFQGTEAHINTDHIAAVYDSAGRTKVAVVGLDDHLDIDMKKKSFLRRVREAVRDEQIKKLEIADDHMAPEPEQEKPSKPKKKKSDE